MNLSKLQKIKLFGIFSMALSFLMMAFSVPITAAKAHASVSNNLAQTSQPLLPPQPQARSLQPQSSSVDTVAIHEASLEAYQQYQLSDGEDRFIKGEPEVSSYYEGNNYVVERSYNDGIGTFTETTVTSPTEAGISEASSRVITEPRWPLANPYHIKFDTFIKTAYSLNGGYFPAYYTSGKPCETAAATIIGYHDRVHTNLMPDQAPGYTQLNGKYEFYSSIYLPGYPPIISYLTTAMSNNGNGVTLSNWKSGLASYVQSRGKTVTYIDVFDYDYNTVALSDVMYHLENNGPLAFFFNGYYQTSTFFANNDLYIHRAYATGQNIFVAYGYEKYLFYTNGNLHQFNWFLIYSDPREGGRGYEHHVMAPEYVAPTFVYAYAIKIQ